MSVWLPSDNVEYSVI